MPILLALIGASLGAEKLTIFVAYGVGMAVVLMALAVAVACAREGVAGRLRALLPHVGRLAGLLLMASGGYLFYYWARIRFGDSLTLGDDPIVGFTARYSARLEGFAGRHGTALIDAAGAIVLLAVAGGLRHRLRRGASVTTKVIGR